MVFEKNIKFKKELMILGLAALACLLGPFYFYGNRDEFLVYGFIFLFGFLFLLVKLLPGLYILNDKIIVTEEGLFISRFLKHTVPWKEISSVSIEYVVLYKTPTIPFLELVFRHDYTDKIFFGLVSRKYSHGVPTKLCSLMDLNDGPEAVVELIGMHIENAEDQAKL